MKANELMIGNYVKFLGKVRKIKSIVRKDTGVEISFEGKNPVGVSLDEIDPIPLTPEILEKNGFVKSRIFVEWKHEKNGIYLLWKPFPWLQISTDNADVNFECIYVHQLQNALSLCGIEKEITI